LLDSAFSALACTAARLSASFWPRPMKSVM
jgi:hypothetical protein